MRLAAVIGGPKCGERLRTRQWRRGSLGSRIRGPIAVRISSPSWGVERHLRIAQPVPPFSHVSYRGARRFFVASDCVAPKNHALSTCRSEEEWPAHQCSSCGPADPNWGRASRKQGHCE